jgi:transposase
MPIAGFSVCARFRSIVFSSAGLKAAQPRLHRNKLATALANKLARIAWSVLRHNTAFDAHRGDVVAI